MKLGAYICRTIKGTIENPLRCVALAGIVFGLAVFTLDVVLVLWGAAHPVSIPVIAPLIQNLALAKLAVVAVVVLVFLGFRNFTASLPGGASITVNSETTIKREGEASDE